MDTGNPVSVARAALKALWTVNTAVDQSPYAAELRATPYMTPAYAAEIRGTPPVAAAGAQWATWARHRVVTTVSLLAEHDSGAPLSSSTVDYLQYGVTITPHGAAGWAGTPNILTEFIVLTRKGSGAPWFISAINTSG